MRMLKPTGLLAGFLMMLFLTPAQASPERVELTLDDRELVGWWSPETPTVTPS